MEDPGYTEQELNANCAANPHVDREIIRAALAYRTARAAFMEAYDLQHAACPVCGGTGGTVTFAGYPLIVGEEEKYQDLNDYVCAQCGNVHTVHERVPKA